jgi:hypothetical protein
VTEGMTDPSADSTLRTVGMDSNGMAPTCGTVVVSTAQSVLITVTYMHAQVIMT